MQPGLTMPMLRLTSLPQRVIRHPRVAETGRRFRRLWAGHLGPALRMGRDMLIAPLSLLTLQFLRGSGWFPSKFMSLAGVLLLAGTAGWTALDPQFYVDQSHLQIHVLSTYELSGQDPYLLPREAWDFQDVLGTHILWQRPQQIRTAVMANPFVTDARVRTYFPSTVAVTVQETTPTLVWATKEGAYAVLADGTARKLTTVNPEAALSGLEYLTLYDLQGKASLNREETHAIESTRLDPELVHTVLVLQQEYADRSLMEAESLQRFFYSQAHGLHLVIPNSTTRVFWGDGLQLAQKMANLRAIEDFVAAQEENVELIDVRPLTKPYYR